MFGIAAATIACAMAGRRARPRTLCALALVILALCDLGSIRYSLYHELIAVRLLAGAAAGTLISFGYLMVGRASNPDRAFGYLITIVLAYSAVGLFAIPQALHYGGMRIIWVILAGMAGAGLLLIRYFPQHDPAAPVDGKPRLRGVRPQDAAMLLAVLSFFVSQGVIWAYLFLIGTSMGIDAQSVANGLTISQFAGIAGALSAAVISSRVPHLVTLVLGTTCTLVGLLLFSLRLQAVGYGIAATIFNWAANLLTPFFIALVADLNPRLVQTAAALQMLGLAVGPTMAAAVIADGHYSTAISLSGALATLSLICAAYGGSQAKAPAPQRS
jgi:predicted MFS family arabinose efflux permease